MQLAVAGRTELCCSVPVLLLIPAAVVFGRTRTLAVCAVSLSLHELSHAFMAHRLGFPIAAIEIQPFGFIARLARSPNTPSESAAIAAAGPVMSLLLALCAAGMLRIAASIPGVSPGFSAFNRRVLSEFSFFNLSLGVVNLLPVLPLDGGRLALSFFGFQGKSARQSSVLLCLCGAAVGALIAAAGVAAAAVSGLSPGPVSFAVTGAFIVLAALSELRTVSASAVRARLSTAARLSSGGAVRVFPLAIDASRTVSDALSALSSGGYALVFVTDAALRTIGMLDEGTLLAAAMRGETDLRLDLLLSHRRKEPDLLTK